MKEANLAISHPTNVSLVAFYGDKSLEFNSMLERLQTYLANHPLLQNKFIPYQLEQIHGTIIGCEGFRSSKGIVSQWFKELRQETKYIDFLGLIDYLQHQLDLPLTIRFGGYDRSINYNFLSRGRHLFERSFQLQTAENQTVPVLIGWSGKDRAVTLAIDSLRRSLQQFNLLHKYHGNLEAVDNDFYLRLGTINGQLTLQESDLVASEIRNLGETSPLFIPIYLKDLAFVQYQDLQLTPATTKVVPIAEITARQLEELYSDY